MSRRTSAFILLAIVFAAIFVRLGFWQLSRRVQRQQLNARVSGRMALPPVDVARLPRDAAAARYRQATVAGSPDWEHELVITARTNIGSPGVHIVTPVRTAGNDTAVLVDRGWAYSPDGSSIDLSRWREERDTLTGYVEALSSVPVIGAVDPKRLRFITPAGIAAGVPYPVKPWYLVVTPSRGDSGHVGRPVRTPAPALDEGPHLSYAIQWFFFALVALAGAALVAMRERHSR
ncbi:MAG: Surfeit locus 1 family protein [Gemmatimonadetes bacterium]|nr:Surfeit locus 1 family protein [Gemmatimonadota bacterium]